jgi:uncharacterized lipoprotein YajG
MNHTAKISIVLLAMIAALAGCGKKPQTQTAITPPADAPVAATPTPAPTASATPPVVQNVNQSFTEVDAALKAKSYDKAVVTLLAVQRQQALSAEQAEEALNRMRGLQANLAAAVAAGDPNAKAAADRLRQAHLH